MDTPTELINDFGRLFDKFLYISFLSRNRVYKKFMYFCLLFTSKKEQH